MMNCFRVTVLIFTVISILCAQRASSDEKAKAANTDSTEATLTFNKTCSNFYDCYLQHPKAGDRVYLACNEGKCQCGNPPNIFLLQDTSIYPVRVSNDVCVARYTAPCGTANGITIVCEEGKTCVEDRCRSQIRSRTNGFYCDEDIDCQEGLKCTARDVFPPSSYCE